MNQPTYRQKFPRHFQWDGETKHNERHRLVQMVEQARLALHGHSNASVNTTQMRTGDPD